MTLTDEENGVAYIRFVDGKYHAHEFYAVFYHGVLQPTRFASWTEAREHFVALLNLEIEGGPA